jgi:hypothetical protein
MQIGDILRLVDNSLMSAPVGSLCQVVRLSYYDEMTLTYLVDVIWFPSVPQKNGGYSTIKFELAATPEVASIPPFASLVELTKPKASQHRSQTLRLLDYLDYSQLGNDLSQEINQMHRVAVLPIESMLPQT